MPESPFPAGATAATLRQGGNNPAQTPQASCTGLWVTGLGASPEPAPRPVCWKRNLIRQPTQHAGGSRYAPGHEGKALANGSQASRPRDMRWGRNPEKRHTAGGTCPFRATGCRAPLPQPPDAPQTRGKLVRMRPAMWALPRRERIPTAGHNTRPRQHEGDRPGSTLPMPDETVKAAKGTNGRLAERKFR